jgi:hypothetical protein
MYQYGMSISNPDPHVNMILTMLNPIVHEWRFLSTPPWKNAGMSPYRKERKEKTRKEKKGRLSAGS